MMWDFWYRLFVLYLQTTATSSYVEIRLNNKINSDSDGLDLDTESFFMRLFLNYIKSSSISFVNMRLKLYQNIF